MTYNPNHTKVFRAEKTTRNRDDFKVLILGLLLGIFILLVLPVAQKLYDSQLIGRPFVSATLEVIQTDQYDRPMILYDADAKLLVAATWIATVRDEQGQRMDTRRGDGNYSPVEDNPRLWTWKAFFDPGDGTPPPVVSDKPFQVCVRYISKTLETEVSDASPEYCSKMFHPELGVIEDIQADGP